MDDAAHEARVATKQHIREGLGHLPSLPSIVSALVTLDSDDAAFSDCVEKLVRVDPPLASRILNFCAIYRPGMAIDTPTIAGAISVLGAGRIAETITSLAVMQVFVPSTAGQKNLWRHSIQVAVGARRFAELRPDLEVLPEYAFLAGLLHDLGRFIMFRNSPRELGQVDEATVSDFSKLIDAEIAICGYDHAELGWLACSQWGLPEPIAVLVRDHHVQDEDCRREWPPEAERLNMLVQFADAASFAVLLPTALRGKPLEARAAAAERAWRPIARGKPLIDRTQVHGFITDTETASRSMCQMLSELEEPAS